MKSRIACMVLFCGLLTGTGFVHAQNHYPAGVEGIKGSSLPPPGFYLRDYNYMYFTNSFPDGPPSFDLFANVQSPRLIWITGKKILGGYYGMDVIVPLVYQNLDMTDFKGSDFSLGDIFIEPITLSWHSKQSDFSFGYGIWTPSGNYKTTDPVSPGKGFLTHMLTGGATFYLDKDKNWSFSALNRYEISTERKQSGITPGQYYTIEYGLGKNLSKTFEIGVVGYYQAQVNQASGPAEVIIDPEDPPDTLKINQASGPAALKTKDSVSAIGPEITFVLPKLGLSTSIRYLREMGANNRPEGNILNLTFTKRLGNSPK
jgi:hypothetical protein